MRDSDQGYSEQLFPTPSTTSCKSTACSTLFEKESCGASGSASTDTSGFAPFNLALQKQRFANMMDILPELLSLFRVNAREHLDTLRSAISRGELPEAATAAHTLKGMSSVVCAAAVQELSGQLEILLKAGDLRSALVVFDDLEAQLARAITSLNSTLAP